MNKERKDITIYKFCKIIFLSIIHHISEVCVSYTAVDRVDPIRMLFNVSSTSSTNILNSSIYNLSVIIENLLILNYKIC